MMACDVSPVAMFVFAFALWQTNLSLVKLFLSYIPPKQVKFGALEKGEQSEKLNLVGGWSIEKTCLHLFV